VLPVGGLNAKLIAALRTGIREVALPWKCRPEIEELSRELTDKLTIHYARKTKDILGLAFPD
jgi:ATP-dependent Lon protease